MTLASACRLGIIAFLNLVAAVWSRESVAGPTERAGTTAVSFLKIPAGARADGYGGRICRSWR